MLREATDAHAVGEAIALHPKPATFPPGAEYGLWRVAHAGKLSTGLVGKDGGILKDAIGVDATFVALAAAASVALLLVTTLMPSQPAFRGSVGSEVPSIRIMVNDFRVLALFAFNFTFGLGMGSVMTFIAVFMTDSMLASATLVGLVVGSRAVLFWELLINAAVNNRALPLVMDG